MNTNEQADLLKKHLLFPSGYRGGESWESDIEHACVMGCDWLISLNESWNPVVAQSVIDMAQRLAALQAKHDALCEAVKHIDEVYCMNVDGQTLADAIDSALELIARQDQPTVR